MSNVVLESHGPRSDRSGVEVGEDPFVGYRIYVVVGEKGVTIDTDVECSRGADAKRGQLGWGKGLAIRGILHDIGRGKALVIGIGHIRRITEKITDVAPVATVARRGGGDGRDQVAPGDAEFHGGDGRGGHFSQRR